MCGVHHLRVGLPNIIWRYILTMFPSFEVRVPATRATTTGTITNPLKYNSLGMKMQRWRESKGIENWFPKAKRTKGLSVSIAGHPIAAAVTPRSLLPERNMQLCNDDPYLSVNHDGVEASTESYPFELEHTPRSCWSTSTRAGFNEFANTVPYVPHHDGYQDMASPVPRGSLVDPRSVTRPANSGHHNMAYSQYATPRST